MRAQVIHNPTSGKSTHHRQEILQFVKQGPFSKVDYVSTEDEGWEQFERNKAEVLVVAGGDGTVQKTVAVLRKSQVQDPLTPIHIIPLGTANNLAKTFSIERAFEANSFTVPKKVRKVDVGTVQGLSDKSFFIEGIGVGIFPALVEQVEKYPLRTPSAALELKELLNRLERIAREYDAERATIKTGGMSISGKFLLLEVMNIQYIGPNFKLAPQADPGDGFFDVVLIPQERRDQLVKYIRKLRRGEAVMEDFPSFSSALRTREVSIEWENSHVHVDDEIIGDFSGGTFKAGMDRDPLFFVDHS